MIDGRPYTLEVGQAYEINNQKIHSVMNKGDTDRITFHLRLRSARLEAGSAGPGAASQAGTGGS